MNPEAIGRVLRDQRRQFGKLLWTDATPQGTAIAPPKAVLAFAEALLICPDEGAVQARIARDREGARGCYIIAGDVVSLVERGGAVIAIPPTPHETPFGLLADVVIVTARTIIAKHGDSWT